MATNDLSIRVINTYFSSSEFLIYLTGPETSVWLSHGPIKLTGFKTELLSLPPLNRSSPRSPSEGRWMARNVFSFLIIFFIHLPHHYSLNTSELHLDFIPMSWSFILNGSLKKKIFLFIPHLAMPHHCDYKLVFPPSSLSSSLVPEWSFSNMIESYHFLV